MLEVDYQTSGRKMTDRCETLEREERSFVCHNQNGNEIKFDEGEIEEVRTEDDQKMVSVIPSRGGAKECLEVRPQPTGGFICRGRQGPRSISSDAEMMRPTTTPEATPRDPGHRTAKEQFRSTSY